jgi:hypothetical protein
MIIPDNDWLGVADWDDIGSDHRIRYYGWAPDRDLNPQYADRPDIEKLGAQIAHPSRPDAQCWLPDYEGGVGGVMFDIPGAEHFPGAKWQLVSWEPLHIEPSVLCRACGDHGYIRDGRWVAA